MHYPVASFDGRYVTFFSEATDFAHAGENDLTQAVEDVYVKDLTSGRVAMVGPGVDGAPPNDRDQIEPRISGGATWRNP